MIFLKNDIINKMKILDKMIFIKSSDYTIEYKFSSLGEEHEQNIKTKAFL